MHIIPVSFRISPHRHSRPEIVSIEFGTLRPCREPRLPTTHPVPPIPLTHHTTPTASIRQGDGITTPPASPPSASNTGEQPGDRIGPYKLLNVTARAGWHGLAGRAAGAHGPARGAQDHQAGHGCKAVIARFEQERQALAVTDHPNVARVLDGGVTPSGRLYFGDGACKGWADLRIRGSSPPDHQGAAGTVHPCVRGRAACAHEGHYSSRPQAQQHSGGGWRRARADCQGHRLRRRQGHQSHADGRDHLHRARADHRHAGVHEPRAGGRRGRHRYADRRVRPGGTFDGAGAAAFGSFACHSTAFASYPFPCSAACRAVYRSTRPCVQPTVSAWDEPQSLAAPWRADSSGQTAAFH